MLNLSCLGHRLHEDERLASLSCVADWIGVSRAEPRGVLRCHECTAARHVANGWRSRWNRPSRRHQREAVVRSRMVGPSARRTSVHAVGDRRVRSTSEQKTHGLDMVALRDDMQRGHRVVVRQSAEYGALVDIRAVVKQSVECRNPIIRGGPYECLVDDLLPIVRWAPRRKPTVWPVEPAIRGRGIRQRAIDCKACVYQIRPTEPGCDLQVARDNRGCGKRRRHISMAPE